MTHRRGGWTELVGTGRVGGMEPVMEACGPFVVLFDTVFLVKGMTQVPLKICIYLNIYYRVPSKQG